MPLSDNELRDVQRRVLNMFLDTITTLEEIEKNADDIYGDRASDVRGAINEYLIDFIRKTPESGEDHPEKMIYQTPRHNFQKAGFYGAQLRLKEIQVLRVNKLLRGNLSGGSRQFWIKPFLKWIDVINNFLGSFISATGQGEALKEIKDCLRDELPD